jgi:hypothetical protein
MSYCVGHSLRDLRATLVLPLGEVLSLAACNRLGPSVTAQLAVCKMQARESPPLMLLVDDIWGKIAYPTGAYRHDAPGHRRSVKRKQKRVVLSALGVWPDGSWEIVHWKVAEADGQVILAFCAVCQCERFERAWSLPGETYKRAVPLPQKALPLAEADKEFSNTRVISYGEETSLVYLYYFCKHKIAVERVW